LINNVIGQSNGMSNGMPRTVPCIEGRILWNRTLPCSSILCGDHCVPHGYRAGTCDIVNDRAICKCSRCRWSDSYEEYYYFLLSSINN